MMRKSAVNISIIIILFVLLITANGDVCISNDVIKCKNYTYLAECTIYQNNIATISQAISLCSAGNFIYFNIHIGSGLKYTTTTITLNLASNIQNIRVQSFASSQPVYIISSQTQPNVSAINLYNLIIYNSDNFYAKFPNVTYLLVYHGYFDLHFSTLKKLTFLYIVYSGQSNKMDKEWVGGLSTLHSLTLYSCGIRSITTDAFENLNSLTALNLGYNYILELAPDVFRDLTALKTLRIGSNRNDIKIPLDSKNNNAFSPLKQLTDLELTYTEIIPFDAFSTLSSIQSLYLPIASSGIVPSTLFQHLHNLTYISFSGISLTCNCNMQWASIIGKFGISVGIPIGIYIEERTGRCSDSGSYVTDSSLYTECGLTESYQCFNKTVACKNTCINTPDSYICACDVGYGLSLLEAESACNDIDECLANKSPCKQKCRNTLGSYQCYCDSGYRLSADLISCTDIDECSKSSWNTCGQHQCMNEVGSYSCTCNPGYQLAGDGYSCYDWNECSDASFNNCNQHTCINVLGNYTLYCVKNGKNCRDINECSLSETNTCGDHQCINEPGSYRCVCNEGFQLAVNNISCHDTDECLDANNSCNQFKCLNLVGSYTCSCGNGYQLSSNGKSCEDIDECKLVTLNSCGSHQCMNEPGSYRCACNEGFQLADSNISCHDTDECMDANNSCNPNICRNLVGSYACLCGKGYQLTSGGKSCEIKPSM